MGVIDVYARVSRLRDAEQASTAAQVSCCREVLAKQGLTTGAVHVDDGQSAWNTAVVRHGWQALMTRLESGDAAGVVIYDLERFARTLEDGERLVRLADRGVIVLDSERAYDLTMPGGKRDFRNAIVAAEYYSDHLSRKVRRGKRTKAEAGSVDHRRSFGFGPDGVTVLGPEAAIIREMAARLLAGETQASLARELDARGIVTIRGARWTNYTTFRDLMTRPRNAGFIIHAGEIIAGVRLPGEPILSSDDYYALVALYAARKPGRPPSGRYLMTGVACCGPCGSALGGRPVHGTARRHYWCRSCSKTFVDAARLDDWAGDFAIGALSDPGHAEALERADSERAAERDRMHREAASIEHTLTEIAGRLGRREISLARHDAVCGPLDARAREIQERLAALAGSEPSSWPQPWRNRAITRIALLAEWDDGDTASRRAMVLRALAGRTVTVGRGAASRFDPARVTVLDLPSTI